MKTSDDMNAIGPIDGSFHKQSGDESVKHQNPMNLVNDDTKTEYFKHASVSVIQNDK